MRQLDKVKGKAFIRGVSFSKGKKDITGKGVNKWKLLFFEAMRIYVENCRKLTKSCYN